MLPTSVNDRQHHQRAADGASDWLL